jgi:hypothetical protein
MVVSVCGVEFGMAILPVRCATTRGFHFPEQTKAICFGVLSGFRNAIRFANRCAFSLN